MMPFYTPNWHEEKPKVLYRNSSSLEEGSCPFGSRQGINKMIWGTCQINIFTESHGKDATSNKERAKRQQRCRKFPERKTPRRPIYQSSKGFLNHATRRRDESFKYDLVCFLRARNDERCSRFLKIRNLSPSGGAQISGRRGRNNDTAPTRFIICYRRKVDFSNFGKNFAVTVQILLESKLFFF